MNGMTKFSDTAWEIASRYSDVLASETRDLAGAIDAALTRQHETAVELADWLARMREGNEESIARNDPVIRRHIAKLTEWEKMLRELAK